VECSTPANEPTDPLDLTIHGRRILARRWDWVLPGEPGKALISRKRVFGRTDAALGCWPVKRESAAAVDGRSGPPPGLLRFELRQPLLGRETKPMRFLAAATHCCTREVTPASQGGGTPLALIELDENSQHAYEE